ncbi:MAG: VirB8/TrbF family protein [Pseudomonadota bacterium]
MRKVFSEPPTAFVPGGDGGSPYAKQLAAMEARFLDTRREIDGWRKVALVLAGIAAVTTVGSLYLATSRPIAVHVVEIDGQTGKPLGHTLIGEPVAVGDAVIAHTLGRWIQMTRSKSLDPVMVKASWDDAYQFVPTNAKAEIDAYARDVDAFNPEHLGKEAIAVEITSVTRQSETSFQVRWVETRFERGQIRGRQSFTANIGTAFIAPTEPRQIQINPLGLMITSIHLQPDVAVANES